MEQEKTDQLNSQSLIEHLTELRSCLVVSFIAVAAGFALSYYFIRPIADWFFRPLLEVLPEGKHLIFISYQEGFFFYLKLSLVCGIILASPVIFLQIWRFIAPGLYKHEKSVLLPFTLVSTLCFIGGAAFGYFVVFPPAFSFFVGYSSEILAPMPGVSEYFSLALRLLIAFGLIFELPVLMVFLAKMGMVNGGFLKKHRKYSIIFAFVIAAILTPTPDVVNQLLMAGPLIVLYEISIIAVAVFAKKTFRGFKVEKDVETDTETDTGTNMAVRISTDIDTNITADNYQKKGD